jgi:branched-chain amino acid transport system ATP-binding protein
VSDLDKILSVRSLNSGYATNHVIFDVDFNVPTTGIVALVGRNGAGKSTLLQTLLGFIKPISGDIVYAGTTLLSASASERIRRGIGYVPQERPVFSDLTVTENLTIGASVKKRANRINPDLAFELFPKLADRRHQKAGTMSGGERKMVGIARALMGDPALLIMDEPTEGVWHGVVDEIKEHLVNFSKDHAVIIVEQNLDFVLDISSQILLLERGVITKRTSGNDEAAVAEVRSRLTV